MKIKLVIIKNHKVDTSEKLKDISNSINENSHTMIIKKAKIK